MRALLVVLVVKLCAAQFADTLVNLRGGDSPVFGVSGDYNYVPTLLFDGNYRAWWCAGGQDHPGDTVYYYESTALDSGWHTRNGATYQYVFRSTGDPNTFDAVHTCDPSIVRADGTYYLYYGGNCDQSIYPSCPGNPQYTTMIGVAVSSDDGMTFSRLNSGNPIVTPQWVNLQNKYGAGQPSVVYKGGYFYMLYTDTTGIASTPAHGANTLYVLRAQDAIFQTGLQSLNSTGFVPYDAATHTSYPFMQGASIDWVYSDQLNQWIVALDGPNSTATRLYFWNEALTKLEGTLDVPGSWTEGPGILARPDHHAPPNPTNPNLVPIDIFRSVGLPAPNFSSWRIGHSGGDVQDNSNSTINYASVFEGSVIGSQGTPAALIIGGVRVQFAIAEVITELARTWYSVSETTFNAIPYGASVYAGNKVLGAPGRPAAFLLDDGKLWPISCLQLILDNGSTITEVTVAQFDSYALGPALYCIE